MSASPPSRALPPPAFGRPRRRLARLGIVLLAAGLAACGSSGSGQSGSSFVFLTVDLVSLNGSTPVAGVNSSLTDTGTATVACFTLRNNLKNPTVTAPTGLDNVVIQSYTVRLARSDGGPPPAPVTINTAVAVPAGTASSGTVSGNTGVVPVIVVTAQAKTQPPLSPPPRLPLSAVAEVTFRGRDGRGQRVETEGAVSVTFVGGSATDSAATCAGESAAATPAEG
jgi:hypothetical protein